MRLNRIWMNILRYCLPNGSVSFWHTPIRAVEYDYYTLSDYYIDFTAKTKYRGPYDDQNIPVLDYRGAIGRRYNPCAIAQYALGWYQRWSRGDVEGRQFFYRMADWLVLHLKLDDKGRGFWYYDFDLDSYEVKAPWISALAQAQGISVLLRAALHASDAQTREKYETAVKAAYIGMTTSIAEGGTKLEIGDDVWLEEIVTERLTAILDGCIFAAWGVKDYGYYFSDEQAEELWSLCVGTIRRHLRDFDLGYWSRADLYQPTPPMPASRFYHRLHIEQLRVLYRQTNHKDFDSMANHWEEKLKSPGNRMWALAKKIAFKIKYY